MMVHREGSLRVQPVASSLPEGSLALGAPGAPETDPVLCPPQSLSGE